MKLSPLISIKTECLPIGEKPEQNSTNEGNVLRFALLPHRFGPDTRLDFAYMGFLEIEHAQTRLTNTATYTERKCSIEQTTMEVEFFPILVSALLELSDQTLTIDSDSH